MQNIFNARDFQQSLRKLLDNVCVAIKKCILKTKYYPGAVAVVYQSLTFGCGAFQTSFSQKHWTCIFQYQSPFPPNSYVFVSLSYRSDMNFPIVRSILVKLKWHCFQYRSVLEIQKERQLAEANITSFAILLLETPCPSVRSSRFLPHPRVQWINHFGSRGVGHTA